LESVSIPPPDLYRSERRQPIRDFFALMVLLSGTLCMGLIFTAMGPVLASIEADMGGDARAHWIAQLLMTLPDIGLIVGSPIAGFLATRAGCC
jgi:MFS family permease